MWDLFTISVWPRLKSLPSSALLLFCCIFASGCATVSDWLDRAARTTGQESVVTLTREQIIAGLKEALNHGVDHAVANLGRDGGFLRDIEVRIPTPESLAPIERALRTVGQDRLVDDFHNAINRAAEKAVPEAVEVLVSSIKQMQLVDAEKILRGRDTEATDYFRRTGETNLYHRFLPIVKEATARTGVTAAYKRMTDRVALGGLGELLLGKEAVDLDGYITGKAMDGLFLKIAEQERLIRRDPVARTTEILRKVFGAASREANIRRERLQSACEMDLAGDFDKAAGGV